MFFLSVEEAEDFTRLKRRKKLDADRAARLKALQDEDKDDPPQSQDVWGDSDEEVLIVFHILWRKQCL
jgi:hypothetical protein